jgi:hypothetical protein
MSANGYERTISRTLGQKPEAQIETESLGVLWVRDGRPSSRLLDPQKDPACDFPARRSHQMLAGLTEGEVAQVASSGRRNS